MRILFFLFLCVSFISGVFSQLQANKIVEDGSETLNRARFLTDQEIEIYYKQGYFVKKGCFSFSEIEEMDEKSQTLIDRILVSISEETVPFSEEIQKMYLEGSQIVFKKKSGVSPSILRVVSCGDLEPRFKEILASEKMIYTFFSLLNCNELEQLICQLHPKLPRDGVSFPKHVDRQHRKNFDPDWKDLQGNGSYAIVAIAIDPMSAENGGLYIDRSTYPKYLENGESDVFAVELEAGDMLFMHPEIVHWSDENNSDRSRRSILAGFCVFGANHKNYPGDQTNNHFIKQQEGVQVQAAPWKKMGDCSFR